MNFLELQSGHKMPHVGLGTGKIIDEKEIESSIDHAIELGYRHFDTATGYKNESGIGKALQKHFLNGTVTREQLFITTKLPLIGMHKERVVQFLDMSLKHLQCEYIDLYLIHWPVGLIYVSENELMPRDKDGELLLDLKTNLEAVWKALEDQVEAGKIRSIGLSNFNEQQIQRILDVCRIPPANLQVEIHAYFQQKRLVDFCKKNGITLCAYAPLGSPGRSKYINAHLLKIHKLLEDPVVKSIATLHEKSPSQILLRFLIQGLQVAVIPKSTDYHRLKSNINIFDFQLTSDEIKRLKGLDQGDSGRSCLPFDGAKNHPECPF